jgi:hypothetical protein
MHYSKPVITITQKSGTDLTVDPRKPNLEFRLDTFGGNTADEYGITAIYSRLCIHNTVCKNRPTPHSSFSQLVSVPSGHGIWVMH